MKELCDALNFRFICKGSSYSVHTILKNGEEMDKIFLCPVHQAYFTNFHKGKFYAFLKAKYGNGEYEEAVLHQKTNAL